MGGLVELYVFTRAAIYGLIAFSFLWPRYGSPRIPGTGHPIAQAVPIPGFLLPLMNWDAGEFVRVAADGYDSRTVPYFPLYPLAIHILSLGQRAWMPFVALAISLLATGLAAVILSRLIAIDRAVAAWPAVALLLTFPGGLFLALPYTEALTLLLFVSSAFAARRGRWWMAGGLGALAAATRPPGVAIVVLLLVEYFSFRSPSGGSAPWGPRLRMLAAVALPFAGLGSYLIYIWLRFGDPRLLLHQELSYGRSLGSLPVQFSSPGRLLTSFSFWVVVASLLLAVWTIRAVRPSYGIFAGVLALAGPLTGELESSIRFVAIAWPLFVLGGYYLADDRRLLAVCSVFAMALGFFAILFSHGYWVA